MLSFASHGRLRFGPASVGMSMTTSHPFPSPNRTREGTRDILRILASGPFRSGVQGNVKEPFLAR